MRTCNVYKLMFFKMDASFKTSVNARKLSGSTVILTYLMILNDITARRFEVLYGLIINFLNLPSGRK